MIKVKDLIYIDEKNISFNFIRSSGPGGQNVNKVSTAVELRFNIAEETCLPEEAKSRLINIAKNRISKEGILIITAKEFRTQEKNKNAAVNRLIKIILKSIEKPKSRKKTKPTKSSEEKRISEKKKRSKSKNIRRNKLNEE